MPVTKVQRFAAFCTFALLCLGASEAFAQTAAQIPAPRVTVNPNNSATVTYVPRTIAPPGNSLLMVTVNGFPIAPIALGTALTLSSNGPLPAGAYTVQVVWPGVDTSDVVGFTIGVGPGITPAQTTLRASVTGTTVFMDWDPIPGVTSYEVEAFVFITGQRFLFTTTATSMTVPNVPVGNYAVKVRGRNGIGYGGFSNQVLIAVLTQFRLRDMEVSLTWNTNVDMDLHIIEPNGTHVWWKQRNGVTTRLDRDNTTGNGPEIAEVNFGFAAIGVYQVFIVHYSKNGPTTSTVAVTLGVGTNNPVTKVFNRTTSEANATLGVNVAVVDIKGGIISEQFGTRVTASGDAREVKKP